MVDESIFRLFRMLRSGGQALLTAVAVVTLLSACATPMMTCCTSEPRLAPVFNEDAPHRIPEQYIVAFKPGTDREALIAAQDTAKKLGGTLRYTVTSEPMTFGATLPANAVQELRAAPGVDYIEADQWGTGITIQNNPPDGLDRTSERLLPLDLGFTYSETGTGVHVYVLDTGISTSHSDFGGRAFGAQNFVPGAGGGVNDTDTDDPHGHGTHVAGIIGGATYGIAKDVTLHAVRVSDSTNTSTLGRVEQALAWVISDVAARGNPSAVINMSLFFFFESPTINTRVSHAITAGITVVVGAGNKNKDACDYWTNGFYSNAIIVSAVDPTDDTRWVESVSLGSNFGSCVDLFAPGAGIVSATPDPPITGMTDCVPVGMTSGAMTHRCSGTSLATAHVSGVAALYLQNHPGAMPADRPANVWTAISNASNFLPSPVGWGGITNPGADSPDVMLHWGSLNDGRDDGEPHITTVDGVHYDFQGAGEYVALRDVGGMEIQTRKTAVPTTYILPNPYTGIETCVSVNTAVAARVGTHRVTYQPNISGDPDPSGLQLRVDGNLVELAPDGLDLGSDGRIIKTTAGSIQIDFPNDTILVVTPGWWSSKNIWYLNMSVQRTRSDAGLMGAIMPGSWLPALPDGASVGPMPADLHLRYTDLYQKFGDAWRVTDETSLFDYAPGTSTATFTFPGWPPEELPCVVPDNEPVKLTTPHHAKAACLGITGESRHADCIFDVAVTGNPGFAETYRLSERIDAGSTTVTLVGDRHTTRIKEGVTFTAVVAPSLVANKRVPTGTVQFTVDGTEVTEPLRLDSKGRVIWKTSCLRVGTHRVAAHYIPSKGSSFLPSTSLGRTHTVRR